MHSRRSINRCWDHARDLHPCVLHRLQDLKTKGFSTLDILGMYSHSYPLGGPARTRGRPAAGMLHGSLNEALLRPHLPTHRLHETNALRAGGENWTNSDHRAHRGGTRIHPAASTQICHVVHHEEHQGT